MRFSSREVLIPLAGPRGGGALCRIAADGHLSPHHPAHLDRSISALLEGGLYQAGQQAHAAVRRLAVDAAWFRRPAPVAVSIVNPGDVAGLAADNSASAELGLALAMLMYISQSPNRIVIATGALEQTGADPESSIRPIHHLRAKFLAVELYFSQAGISSPPALFVTPERDPDGTLIREKYCEQIETLRSMGIEVVSVRNLRAAAIEARATRMAEPPSEIWLRRGVVAALILGALAAGRIWLSNRPIAMAFLDTALDDGRIVQLPARLHPASAGIDALLASCRTANGQAEFEAGDRLVAEVASGSQSDPFGRYDRIYHLIVVISPETGAERTEQKSVIKIPALDPKLAEGIRPGERFGFSIELFGQPNEDNLMFVLAQRRGPFDSDLIHTKLHQRLDTIRQSERLSAAHNYLSGVAPGFLEYRFRITDTPGACHGE
jgi:hypothetical protein